MKTLLLAEWIAPMEGAVVREGGIVFDQTVIALGGGRELRGRYPDAQVIELGQALVTPGLVNGHVHLELSDCQRPLRPPGSFVEWLKQVMSRRALEPQRLAEVVREAVKTGVRQCLRFGVTAVGDISRESATTRAVLQGGAIRAVSYGEVQAMGQRRRLLGQRISEAADPSRAEPRLRIGLSPHAPYSVEAEGYRQCLKLARRGGLPLATHLAETPHEAEFLAEHRGPFRELWDWLGWWDQAVPRFDGGPIRFAQAVGLLDYPTLLAHVNCIDDEEMQLLADGRASVVYCPRTHAWFGRDPHRWREMLALGINVAVGTDSCASSGDLNLLDDLRLLHHLAPDEPVERLWRMGTVRAARAIGMDRQIGSLAPGKAADLLVFPVEGDEPLRRVLERKELTPTQVWIGGRRVTAG